MKTSRVKRKLAHDEPAIITLLHFTDESVFELAGVIGFDGIWMDMEHHGYSLETAGGLMRAFRLFGGDIVARPANGEFMRMGRMLEAGANGIMYPRCADAAEAAEVVKWAKFPPMGKRGADGGNADMPYGLMDLGDYIREANEQTFIVIQLEDPDAIANAEAIAAVEGVDVLMLGPADFSIAVGVPGQVEHPKVQDAVKAVATAAHNAGKHWGMPMRTNEAIQRYMAMGARFILHASDMGIMNTTFRQIRSDLESLGIHFSGQI